MKQISFKSVYYYIGVIKGVYYELFNLKGKLLDKGFLKFGFDKMPKNLINRLSFTIRSNYLYLYDKKKEIMKKYKININ